jgi:2-dehydropantoate 2-reductase
MGESKRGGMQVVILGAGAMGSLFGAMLQRAGQAVVLVDVWLEHVAAINQHGLLVEREGRRETIPITALLPHQLTAEPDCIVLFTKAFHTEAALAGVQAVLSHRTHILTLQNGIGQVEIIERFCDRSRIMHGITTYPCDLVGPGHIRTQGSGQIKMMSVDGREHDMLRQVHGMLCRAGFECIVSADTSCAIWEKLAFNAAMNAMAAVLRLPVGKMGDAPEGRQLAGAIVAEAVAVAQQKGIDVDGQRIAATVAMAFAEHREHHPSMLQDIQAKRRTEIDFINGAIVAHARALGLPAPVNETLFRLVKTLEAANTSG